MDTKLGVLKEELEHEANTRIDQIEKGITKLAQEIKDTHERLLSPERYFTLAPQLLKTDRSAPSYLSHKFPK